MFAKTDASVLADVWQKVDLDLPHEWLRPAETGTVMVRGRTGGSGAPFNMGEMSVTRATVRLSDGTVGFGYVAGRAYRKAELAALLDAACQRDDALAGQLLPPLKNALDSKRDTASRKAAATKVEFFTLVRGSNPT